MSDCLLTDGNFGNPASRSHVYGWLAEEAVEEARTQVAKLLNCDPREIVWTSGATESDNLAIKGVAEANGASRRHIVTSAIEHKAVLDTCAYLETKGYEVTYLQPGPSGIIEPEQVAAALRPDTLLVSLMHVNNEIGVINDIAAIGDVCRAAGVLFHVDAAQSAGKVPIDLATMKVDLMSLSRAQDVRPERHRRVVRAAHRRRCGSPRRFTAADTRAACGRARSRRIRSSAWAKRRASCARAWIPRTRASRHCEIVCGRILQQSKASASMAICERRLPGNLNVAFAGVDGETLMLALDDLRGIERLGVHVGDGRTVVRTARAGSARRSRACVVAIHRGAVHHRRRHRSRRASRRRSGRAVARTQRRLSNVAKETAATLFRTRKCV